MPGSASAEGTRRSAPEQFWSSRRNTTLPSWSTGRSTPSTENSSFASRTRRFGFPMSMPASIHSSRLRTELSRSRVRRSPFPTNTKGVTCVLNGMRRRNYVDDSLGVLRSPPFDVDLHLYETFNQI